MTSHPAGPGLSVGREPARREPRRRFGATHHTNPAQILALRGSGRPLKRPLSRRPPHTRRNHRFAWKAPSVRLRLHGTRSEIAATLAALAQVLTIHMASRPYPDRPPSTLERVYLDIVPPSMMDGRR
jgi:hypothetical protein